MSRAGFEGEKTCNALRITLNFACAQTSNNSVFDECAEFFHFQSTTTLLAEVGLCHLYEKISGQVQRTPCTGLMVWVRSIFGMQIFTLSLSLLLKPEQRANSSVHFLFHCDLQPVQVDWQVRVHLCSALKHCCTVFGNRKVNILACSFPFLVSYHITILQTVASLSYCL